MINWPAKSPGSILDYVWIVPLDSGDTVASASAVSAHGTVSIVSQSNTTTTLTVKLSGGVAGETAAFTLTATTAGGRTFEETAFLTVENAFAAPTETEIMRADLASLRTARLALAKGERVEEVWRDGRRLTFGKVTLEGITTLIRVLESDLEAQQSTEEGRPRRRPINLTWMN